MKKDNEMKLGEAIQLFLKRNGLEEKLLETEIYGRWEELVGRGINSKTRKVELRDGVLHVLLTSSVLRNELRMRRSVLLESINQRLAPRAVIRDLKFR
ncbi:MAG: DUF721 domain-containing protein [Owenweeksia sp.]|nr:DUF721 domain-containing protein [Owenweeksia sp.]